MNLSWGGDPSPRGTPWAGGSASGPRRASTVPGLPVRPEPEPLAVDPADRHLRIAAELAPMVGVWERILVAHQPDRSGRCRTCTQGGTGLPGTRWPCVLHGLAELARRRHGLAEGA